MTTIRLFFHIFVGLLAVFSGYIVVSTPSRAKLPVVPESSPTKAIPSWLFVKPRLLLNKLFRSGVRATTSPKDHVMELATSYFQSEVVYMLAQHKIFDSVGEKPRTCQQVAESLALKAHVVCEFMKAGYQLGLFSVAQDGYYSPTMSGKLLQTGSSLRDESLFINEETRHAWRAAGTKSAKTGKSGWEEAFGEDHLAWYEKHRDKSDLFERARMSIAESEAGTILSDWTPPRQDGVFCDIGGGAGETLAHVLDHYPKMTGIVMDKTYKTLDAMQLFQAKALTAKAKFLGGFFFAPTLPKVLSECDVFFLKHVLDDFDDETSSMILEKIKAVAKSGAKLAIAENVQGIGFLELSKALSSVNLIASRDYGARERSTDEYKRLLTNADYKNKPVITSLRDKLSIIEVDV
eukprot:CAMPEP_0119015032 /NCGR_PEP_ID=MMETSP1176-20130426/10520_1 /TAXON_ID=265551 /ORGANISM="Synedropsis recta cf, Strain CCMP1620" /LENGTH=405 /DNA_ID=CAMNT_0006968291 /DNA_START=24 /DNA_END=1241 /DNA_ORIENTATION=+